MERGGNAEALFTRRSVLESQDPATLVALKADMQGRVDSLLRDMSEVDEVLDGYGYTRCDPGAAYDANDGTVGAQEHPEDDKWIHRGLE